MAARFKLKIPRNIGRSFGVVVVGDKVQDVTPELIAEVRKEFRKIGPTDIRRVLLRNVEKGISPVGKGERFKTYSKSYRDVINGKGSFRKIGGKTIFLKGKKDPILDKARPKKRTSPVSMRLTGEMNESLKLFTTGGFFDRFRLVFDWRNELADIHNRLGASKKKVVRRILPTKKGEEFNETINKRILDRLNDSARNVIRRLFG